MTDGLLKVEVAQVFMSQGKSRIDRHGLLQQALSSRRVAFIGVNHGQIVIGFDDFRVGFDQIFKQRFGASDVALAFKNDGTLELQLSTHRIGGKALFDLFQCVVPVAFLHQSIDQCGTFGFVRRFVKGRGGDRHTKGHRGNEARNQKGFQRGCHCREILSGKVSFETE